VRHTLALEEPPRLLVHARFERVMLVGMMTIVTHVKLKEGSEPEWDAAMRERLAAAMDKPGWIGGQLMMPLDHLDRRVIVGTWETRADWEAWHQDPAFEQTRTRMEGLEEGEPEQWWHEVLIDVRHP
jgi:heme-degrading monooxygenase HmoA